MPLLAIRRIRVETSYYEAILSGYGGRLNSFRLKKFKQNGLPDSPDYQMIRPGERMPMGVLVSAGGRTIDDQKVIYTSEALSPIVATPGHPASVTLTGTANDGVTIRKTFTFWDSSYVFDLSADVRASNGVKPGAIGFTMSQPLTELSGYRDYPSLQWYLNGKAYSAGQKQLEKGGQSSGTITYAGFGDRYFLSAFLPKNPASCTLAMDYAGGEGDARIVFAGATSATTQVFMGPKALEVLESVTPALKKALDMGFWGMIAIPFLRLLKLFYQIAPNYGVAIILLTVLVRLVTLPMSIRGQRSMMKMQRLQPQVERIRER